MMADVARSTIRIQAFVRKELVEIVRQPRLVVTLVLGPFLILLLFGAGLRDEDPPVQAAIVAPEGGRLTALAQRFADTSSRRLNITDISDDEQAALERLRRGQLDIVVVFPDDPTGSVRQGEQAVITLYHNYIDPIETRAVEISTEQAAEAINEQVSRALVVEAQQLASDVQERVGSAQDRVVAFREAAAAGDAAEASAQLELLDADLSAVRSGLGITAGALQRLDRQVGTGSDSRPAALRLFAEATRGAEGLANAPAAAVAPAALDELTADLDRLGVAVAALRALPADVIVSPFAGIARRAAGIDIGLTGFYAPAVVVLLLQHLVVTFIGLSTVREEQLGTTELFRVAPLSTAELLAGKFLAYLLLGGGVSAVLVLLLVTGLGVPMLGSWWLLACSVVAVLSASIAMGFVIALLSGSDSQAVQYAMLALLSSIFFSGFILSSQRFVPALDALAHLLPATYGIAMLRGEMLRGSAAPVYLLGILAGMTVLLLGVAWVLLSRRLRRG